MKCQRLFEIASEIVRQLSSHRIGYLPRCCLRLARRDHHLCHRTLRFACLPVLVLFGEAAIPTRLCSTDQHDTENTRPKKDEAFCWNFIPVVSDDEGTGIQVWGAVFAAPCTVKAARVGNVEPQRAWPITAGLRPTRLWRRRADAECGDTRQLVRLGNHVGEERTRGT